MANHQLDHEILNRHKSSTSPAHHLLQEKKPRPQPEQALRCPRCDSTNTKFCYYNNYSLSQPRYFCKGCRRYWTKGGSLRNVPVGGGCRKNKRSSPSASNSSSTSSKKPALQDPQDIHNPRSLLLPSMPLPPLTYDPSDLTLAFSSFHSHDPFLLGNPNPNPNGPAFLDILRGADHSQNHGGGGNGGGLHSLYYGFSGGGGDDFRGLLSFDGGVGGCSDSTAVAAEPAVVGNSDPGSNVHSTSTSHGSFAMESGRDYWSGVASNSSWHGLINSSLL